MPKNLFQLLNPFLAALVTSVAAADPVRTDTGFVAGTASSDGTVRIYRGIPYAKPPVGDLRWRAPQPPLAWDGVLQADHFQSNCMQREQKPNNSLFTKLFYSPSEPRSEDCLYLNIWTAGDRDARRPVMVWIHGGGFRGGSTADPLYDGANLAQQGITFVSINYRLWKFGFFAHPTLNAESHDRTSGNYGLMDQIAALQWVQRNISQFGGDPSNVTIFGQSAGAYSVQYLIASPLAKGLFARAIAESGSALAPARQGSLLGHTLESQAQAETAGMQFAAAAGAKTLAELRAKPPEALLAASSVPYAWPHVDGYVLPDTVDRIYARGAENNVPVIIGSTANEGSLFPLMHRTLQAYLDDAHKQFGPLAGQFLKLYPAHDDESAQEASRAARREGVTGWGTWIWAKTRGSSDKAPLYYYDFGHVPPAPPHESFTENTGAKVGAYHGAELAYVFGNFYPTEWTWNAGEKELSRQIQAYWVNFAKTGNPNGRGLPSWTAFDPAHPRVMSFGHTPGMGPVTKLPLYEFWSAYAASWDKR